MTIALPVWRWKLLWQCPFNYMPVTWMLIVGAVIFHFSDKIKSYRWWKIHHLHLKRITCAQPYHWCPIHNNNNNNNNNNKTSFNRTPQHTLNIPSCPHFFCEVQGTLSWSAEFSLRLLSSLLDAYRDAIVAPTFYNLVACDSLWNQGAPPSTNGLYEFIWRPASWRKDTTRLHSRQIRVKANPDADGLLDAFYPHIKCV